MPRVPAVVAAFLIALSVSALLSTPALAHERRQVGPFEFVVGWLAEPAFQGQANAASVRISDTRVTPAKPLEGLQQTLTIEIVSGGLSPYTGTVRAVFGQPGLYALDVVPTAAGSYSFRIKGKVETLDVNEVFESGPGRFDEVKGQTSLQYPEKVPVAADLTDRLDAIQQDLGSIRALAIAALALAIALPLGAMWRARQRR
jgi:hypothetical protein